MNYQYGFNLVMAHPQCINEIALSLNNRSLRWARAFFVCQLLTYLIGYVSVNEMPPTHDESYNALWCHFVIRLLWRCCIRVDSWEVFDERNNQVFGYVLLAHVGATTEAAPEITVLGLQLPWNVRIWVLVCLGRKKRSIHEGNSSVFYLCLQTFANADMRSLQGQSGNNLMRYA